jgi:hypothetical protein
VQPTDSADVNRGANTKRFVPGFILHAAEGQSALPEPLQEQKRDDDGHYHHQCSRYYKWIQALRPAARARQVVPRGQPDGQWIVLGGAQDYQRQEVVVPRGYEGQEENGDEAGYEDAEGDAPEDAQLAGAIHACRIEEVIGNRLLGVDAHEVDAEREY